MDPEFREHATEKLLGDGDRRNSEGEEDYKSNRPGNNIRTINDNQPFSASLNSDNVRMGRQDKDSLHGDDMSNGHSGEERKQSGAHIVTTKSSLRQQTVLKTRRRRQAPKRTIWNEIVDLIIFCYEFILIMAVIASGSLLASIPCSIYVVISLLYLGLQIVIENRKVSNRV